MLASDRLEKIVALVSRAGSMGVAELADELGVTQSTIRRDLAALERANRIARVHGGATSLERAHVTRDLTLGERSGMHSAEKEAIAAYASGLVGEGDFVYIDSGSTTLRLIEALPVLDSVTYMTDSVGHARRLAARGLRVLVTGGELKPRTESLVGPDAVASLSRYRFACGFWGANGIEALHGMSTPDIGEAEVKRAAMAQTERRYVLADASKFDMRAPVSFAPIDAATIITAGEVPRRYLSATRVVAVPLAGAAAGRGGGARESG